MMSTDAVRVGIEVAIERLTSGALRENLGAAGRRNRRSDVQSRCQSGPRDRVLAGPGSAAARAFPFCPNPSVHKIVRQMDVGRFGQLVTPIVPWRGVQWSRSS